MKRDRLILDWMFVIPGAANTLALLFNMVFLGAEGAFAWTWSFLVLLAYPSFVADCRRHADDRQSP